MVENNNLELENVTKLYENGVEIKIPLQYLSVYKVILILFTELGLDMLNDCKTLCKNRNKSIIDCYIMFQTAMAQYYNGNTETTNHIIDYIKAQLNLIARQNASKLTFTLPIDNNGNVNLFIVIDNPNNNPTTNIYIDKTILEYLEQIFATKEELNELNELNVESKIELTYDELSIESDNYSIYFIDAKLKPNSTEVLINGLQYTNEPLKNGTDYNEIYDFETNTYIIGIKLNEEYNISDNENIVIKGIKYNE